MDTQNRPIMLTNLRQRIESTTDLPAMPGVAQALLRLNSNPNGSIDDLVAIIETDPSIAAQILRYSRSAFFGCHGETNSLHQTVTVVLGYDLTMNVALGLSLGKVFNIPNHGRLGLYAFWQHSMYSAALIERIIQLMPQQPRPLPGLGFLSGLLHNFGVLLIAHLFQKEAVMLRQIVTANPDKSVIELERQILGTDHMEIGAWLMRSWSLPAEIQVAVAGHHDELYSGIHTAYAHLTLLADRLLKRHGIGDAESTELPSTVLASLGLNETQLETQLENIMGSANDLDLLAEKFVA